MDWEETKEANLTYFQTSHPQKRMKRIFDIFFICVVNKYAKTKGKKAGGHFLDILRIIH